MLNLIKMEVYRLLHTPSLYVMLLLMMVMAYIAVRGTGADMKEMKQELTKLEQEQTETQQEQTEKQTYDDDSGNVNVGISMAWDASWLDGVTLPELLDNIYSTGLLMLFVAIFIPLFVAGEQKSGYIKNIIGQLPFRGQLALSKLVPVATEIFMAIIVFDVSVMIFSNIYMNDYFTMGRFGEFLVVLGYHFLTHAAFGILLTFLVLLLCGTSGAMVFGILLSLNVFYTIYLKLDKWLDVKVSDYVLSTNMCTQVLESSNKLVTRGVVVSAIFLIVSMALAVLTLQKRDIR